MTTRWSELSDELKRARDFVVDQPAGRPHEVCAARRDAPAVCPGTDTIAPAARPSEAQGLAGAVPYCCAPSCGLSEGVLTKVAAGYWLCENCLAAEEELPF